MPLSFDWKKKATQSAAPLEQGPPAPRPPAAVPGARSPLGEILVERGGLTDEDLERALVAKRARPALPLGHILVELNLCTQGDVDHALRLQRDHPAQSPRPHAIPEKASIEEILRSRGAKDQHVRYALERAATTGESLPAIMRDFGFVDPETLADALARHHGYDYFAPAQIDTLDATALGHLQVPKFAGFVPVGRREGKLLVAVSEIARVNEAANAFHRDGPRIVIASARTVQTVYRRYLARTAEEFDRAVKAFEEAVARGIEEDNPGLVQDIFGALVRHACYVGASDLYLHKSEAVGVLKLKVNGSGQLFRSIKADLYEKLLNKLVTESGIKAEDLRREPQEASVEFRGERAQQDYADILTRYAFRLELAQAGDERQRMAVIRILDRQSDEAQFARLGFDALTEGKLRRYLASSTGLVIVTGPTGSGKTTTLYAMLKEIDPVERAIETIENPIEYRHGLWMQQQVSRDMKEGEGVRKLLNALLRMAPDVILFGEVRNDLEVANTLLDAANTGHLVFTTLHTNSAALAINRLKQIGVGAENLAAVLKGILAQRLVQVLCPACKTADTREETVGEFRRATYLEGLPLRPMRAAGCPACKGTGYRGRHMIYELLDVAPQIREMIEAGATSSAIGRRAIAAGQSMWACGLRLVAQGVSSIDEVRRVAEAIE